MPNISSGEQNKHCFMMLFAVVLIFVLHLCGCGGQEVFLVLSPNAPLTYQINRTVDNYFDQNVFLIGPNDAFQEEPFQVLVQILSFNFSFSDWPTFQDGWDPSIAPPLIPGGFVQSCNQTVVNLDCYQDNQTTIYNSTSLFKSAQGSFVAITIPPLLEAFEGTESMVVRFTLVPIVMAISGVRTGIPIFAPTLQQTSVQFFIEALDSLFTTPDFALPLNFSLTGFPASFSFQVEPVFGDYVLDMYSATNQVINGFIRASNKFDINASIPLQVTFVTVGVPDSTSTLNCSNHGASILITDAQTSVSCSIIPRLNGVQIFASSDNFVPTITNGTGSFSDVMGVSYLSDIYNVSQDLSNSFLFSFQPSLSGKIFFFICIILQVEVAL